MYGKELIIDLHDCNPALFSRVDIGRYFDQLCELIDMQAQDRHFWDDTGVPPEECQTNPKTKGTSAIQFILTSNVTLHALDILETVYVNIFSCKDFNSADAMTFSALFFEGRVEHFQEVDRV